MSRESIVFAISGAFFGLLVGWILGSQQPQTVRSAAPATQAASKPSTPADQVRPVDAAQVERLRAVAQQNPQDAAARAHLGNVYFDAGRFDEAIRWYEDALRIEPRNPDVSTDLGVSYYYLNQPDRALAQFEHSLSIDPAHVKTMLNMGIVRAFGKQDLAGAAADWQRVVELAPDSPEGRAARQALENLKAAHPDTGTPPGNE